MVMTSLVPPGRSHGVLAVDASRSRSRGFQRREARSHGGAVVRAQRVAVNLNSQSIGDLLAVCSHVVEVFGFEVTSGDRVDDSIA